MRTRMNVYFPPELLRQLIDLADRKRLSRSSIVEAAVASFLSPDGADRTEAAFTRRLDRLSRQIQRLERDLSISTETLALFVRFWLSVTPQLSPDAQAAAQAKGRERFEGFVEALGRRLAQGRSLLRDIPDDIDLSRGQPSDEPGIDAPGVRGDEIDCPQHVGPDAPFLQNYLLCCAHDRVVSNPPRDVLLVLTNCHKISA